MARVAELWSKKLNNCEGRLETYCGTSMSTAVVVVIGEGSIAYFRMVYDFSRRTILLKIIMDFVVI